ncbi:precorrin-6y C5,15-methyltransferase (decarboxylating) subunit CbiE [Acidisphaera rubrifaciens]|uniref:Cobalamin (Vitamin B12) biosynthesis protein/precorrin-6Y C5,15-methyltransferase n=1 Tax=Acidisphaera rubrifaciens HS-AP3 TaxID=1231350 RepID=A0A0D6P661_9PROT|nr:precorrin-6y C5,15-methyltransferase (decarboxylating) subunit CbiE [Acidisphaera rubrifaciens]GAN76831.1 cobalamin (vitamin B12) biosynthesis protein/precorrin-6Y C5,15-methyltransferase [Acidisphaera rubrifaciens HS-AP3]
MSMHWLSILGIGEDGVQGLSAATRSLLANAEIVFGAPRHLKLAGDLPSGARRPWPSPMRDAVAGVLAERGRRVAVLASGDPFCFGIGSLLAEAVPVAEFVAIPAPSAFAWACAALGWARQDITTLSLCGRPPALLRPHLHDGARILALSADAATPAAVGALLRDHGYGPTRITALEALGGPRARIRRWTAGDAAPDDVDPLNLLALEVVAGPGAQPIPYAAGLPESLFEHDGQITKRETRALTLAQLAPRHGDYLWDIGCASGSVAIEWLLRHPSLSASGIEARPDRAARAARNAMALGVPRLDVRTGAAPTALDGLPRPDAVFVGGGITTPGLLDAAWSALRPGGRIVVNAVTWDSEAVLFDAWKRLGGEVTRQSVGRLSAIGGQHGFRPAMTVTQWAATKP